MPEVSWTNMKQSFPKAHLIVGIVPAADVVGTGGLKLRVELLARLARHLQLSGSYAIADVPEGIGQQVHCILEQPEDAVALANALEASEGTDHPDYASHRTFRCDNAAAAAIEGRLREETAIPRNTKDEPPVDVRERQ
jgi:hypothetical protein